MLAQDLSSTVCGIVQQLSMDHHIVCLIIQNHALHPYCYTQVQGFIPYDGHRLQLCEWLVQEHRRNSGFVEHILLTDKAAFTCERAFKCHSSQW